MIRKELVNVGCHNSRGEIGPRGAMLPWVFTSFLSFNPIQNSENLVFWVAGSGGLEPGSLLHNMEVLHYLSSILTHAVPVTVGSELTIFLPRFHFKQTHFSTLL